MIFTVKKLTGDTVDVRWYKYSDPDMGRGDAGTESYARYPMSAFLEKAEERFPKGCNDFYYTYEFTEEWSEKLKTIIGKYWWIDRGYELAAEDKKQLEIERTRAILNIAMTIEIYE